jgi:hypothetical protein
VSVRAIKDRALELAAAEFGAGKVTRVGRSMIRQAQQAAAEAVDIAIQQALAQHRMTARTLKGTSCDPLAPRLRGRMR